MADDPDPRPRRRHRRTSLLLGARQAAPLWFACPLARAYWRLAPLVGVRPEVAYVQAAHETGFGKFGRAVTREHNNFCGLKVTKPGADDAADSHARFPTLEVGVLAHLEHLALYAGAPGFPRTQPVDTRHSFGWHSARRIR